MKFELFAFLFSGILAGILGGMGMGGGTVLIPILTIFLGVSQHTSQAVNLVSFVPMAIVALIVHAKNKLIKTRGILLIIIPAVLISLGSSLLSASVNADLLKRLFGAFLVGLSLVEFFAPKIVKKLKEN
jgi:uncharacterized membrane protein YfcA